jgi:hypothetical protein
MLRKLVAFIVGLFLILGIGLVMLHSSLQLIGLWLTPVFGIELYSILSLVFLLFGNPLSNLGLLLVWFLVSIVIGIVVGKRLGAIITGLLVWLLLFPLLGVSMAGLIFNITQLQLGFSEANSAMIFPPVPRGLDVIQLLKTPIIGDVASKALIILNENPGQMIGLDFFMEILYNLALWVVAKPVLIIIGVIAGVELSKTLHEKGLLNYGSKSSDPPTAGSLSDTTLQRFFLILILLGSSLQCVNAKPLNTSDGVYIEQLLGLADKQGRVILTEVFLESQEELSLPEGFFASIILAQEMDTDKIVSLLPEAPPFDIASYINLVPRIFHLTLFTDTTPNEAIQRIDSIHDYFKSMNGLTLTKLAAFRLPELKVYERETTPPLTLVISVSMDSFSEISGLFLAGFKEDGGLTKIVQEGIESGSLIPGANEFSSDSCLFLTGIVKSENLMDLLPKYEIPIELQDVYDALYSSSLSFAVGAHYWEQGARSTPTGFTLNLNDLLDINSSPSYASISDISFITFVMPNNLPEDFTTKVLVRTNLDESNLMLSAYSQFAGILGELEYVTDTYPDIESLVASSNVHLPPRLKIDREVEKNGDGYKVRVSLENLGASEVSNVIVDDSEVLSPYNKIVAIKGETLATINSLRPGESWIMEYNVYPEVNGIYSLKPTVIKYNAQNSFYKTISKRALIETGPPSIINILTTLIDDISNLRSLLRMN